MPSRPPVPGSTDRDQARDLARADVEHADDVLAAVFLLCLVSQSCLHPSHEPVPGAGPACCCGGFSRPDGQTAGAAGIERRAARHDETLQALICGDRFERADFAIGGQFDGRFVGRFTRQRRSDTRSAMAKLDEISG